VLAMRFEAEKALAHISELDYPRDPGSAPEWHAADYVAEQLEQLGWNIERHAVLASRVPDLWRNRLAWPAMALAMTTQTAFSIGGHAPSTWFACTVVAVLCWISALFPIPHFRRAAPLALCSQNVIASLPGEKPPAARVVLLADLDTERGHWPRQLRFLLESGITVLVIVLALCNFNRFIRLPRSSRLGLLALCWIFVIARVCDGLVFRRGTSEERHGSSLAALIEIARTLPRSVRQRVEIQLAALGMQSLDQAGARAIAQRFDPSIRSKPTLFLHLIEPEASPALVVVGRGDALILAENAARGLWIPHRVQRHTFFRRGFGTTAAGLEGASIVSLIGERHLERERLFTRGRRAPVDRDQTSIGPAVQIATEIALRWARQHAQTDPGASVARSSQKPG
jgi:hypothetical protein